MRFDIITTFPKIFDSYFGESIIKRAQKENKIIIQAHDLREYTTDKHRTTDDTPYGGGAGMVLKAEPILKAVNALRNSKHEARNAKIVILSAKGRQFTQKAAQNWAKKYQQIIFISGRYEGIDERVKKILKAEEISIGPYVLTDGDAAAMAIVSAVARLIPGVIASKSLQEESNEDELEYPQYTRPEVLEWHKKKYRVPNVLLSGNHKEINAWRKNKRM